MGRLQRSLPFRAFLQRAAFKGSQGVPVSDSKDCWRNIPVALKWGVNKNASQEWGQHAFFHQGCWGSHTRNT